MACLRYLFVVLTVALPSIAVDYCNIKSCADRRLEQTMCIYEDSTPGNECGSNVESVGVTSESKAAIVRRHNELRKYVADGLEEQGSPGPQPPARNMPPLEWDDELELVAQRWANQCSFGHDKCRDVDRYYVGQNVGVIMSTGENTAVPEDIIQLWYDEVKLFNRSEACRFVNSPGIGHYTQLVWGNTVKIGCGEIRYTNLNGWNAYYLVCNYGPGGNMLYAPVYSASC